ncbi:hypothetical protein EVG20_g8191 [Dentipellis fragilis]|uniref:Uncharacterized protein n=1 Tax=Dentipellis fragilis TaxID=205917 RepID=A0A4Y9Y990_9AGAM|nr:hypothetical protein EVG20_g8191 [Dentipellis fragilis]
MDEKTWTMQEKEATYLMDYDPATRTFKPPKKVKAMRLRSLQTRQDTSPSDQLFTESMDTGDYNIPLEWTTLDPRTPPDDPPNILIGKTNFAQQLAITAAKDKPEKTLEEMVPPHYHEYKDVFEKQASERLPTRRPWDHAIDLKPDAEPYSAKAYPMSPNELRVVLRLHLRAKGLAYEALAMAEGE